MRQLFLKLIMGIFLLAVVLFLFKIPIQLPTQPVSAPFPLPSSTMENKQTVQVVRVIDGDTIEIEGGQKVRYIGINTPETVDPRRSVMCFGKEAYLKNKELIEGKKVQLEKDISEIDKYGRLLRYVYLINFEGTTFINDYLVRQGYAYASSYPPDIKYQERFREAEKEARENNRGLWNACQAQK